MNTWFIFTSTGGLATIKADTVSKAVASFRKTPHPRAGEIVGVIRAAAQMESYSGPLPTPVFGVIQYHTPTVQTAGATSGRRVVFATFDLLDGEPVPAGLASVYYAARSVLHYAGTIRLHQQDCAGVLLPGHVLNLTDGQDDWETMNAVVQQTVEDLIWGTTEITLGPPEHLSPQDFVAIMTPFRNRGLASAFAKTKHNGTEGVEIAEGEEPGITGFGPAPALEGEDADEDGNVPAEVRETNPDAGIPPPPGLFSTIDLGFCDTSSSPPVSRTARVVGIVVNTPS